MKNHYRTLAAVILLSTGPLPLAMATDTAPAYDSENAARELAEQNRRRARQANESAVDEAAAAILAATRLDLDIRMAGHKSVRVAARQ